MLHLHLVPYDQEIVSIDVYSTDDGSLILQWELLHTPVAEERFNIKFTIQSSKNIIAIREVDMSCDMTCHSSRRVSYELPEVETDSIYIAEVTVINLYGQSTRMYLFYPQAIISEAIGGTDNSASIAVPLVIIIILLLSGYIIILVIFVIWYLRYYRTKQATDKEETPKHYVEMSTRDPPAEVYYNLANESREDIQFYAERNMTSLEAIAEPTYAHIDEDSKVIEEVKEDRDYEIMKPDDSTDVTYFNVSTFVC